MWGELGDRNFVDDAHVEEEGHRIGLEEAEASVLQEALVGDGRRRGDHREQEGVHHIVEEEAARTEEEEAVRNLEAGSRHLGEVVAAGSIRPAEVEEVARSLEGGIDPAVVGDIGCSPAAHNLVARNHLEEEALLRVSRCDLGL